VPRLLRQPRCRGYRPPTPAGIHLNPPKLGHLHYGGVAGRREAIIEACPPIATAFNRSWTPFRTLRCRWRFLSSRNWESRKSLMSRPRPSWIWPVRNQATTSRWRKSAAGSACDPPSSFPPCRGARSGASGSRRQGAVNAALVRFAATGHGDVKSLKDRPGELLDERGHRHSVTPVGQALPPANFSCTGWQAKAPAPLSALFVPQPDTSNSRLSAHSPETSYVTLDGDWQAPCP
jgi:hypothetical protein